MRKTILFPCTIGLMMMHGSFASPEKEQGNKVFVDAPAVVVNMSSIHNHLEPDLEAAHRSLLLQPRELPARTKIIAGMAIGIPLVFIAAYVGLH